MLLDEELRIGCSLRHAVRASRAPIVANCDDDAFELDRRAHRLAVFGQHPGLGFYGNQVTTIDGDTRAIPPER